MERNRDLPDLDPNDLLLFMRVVEAGSLTRAAERLGMPKSTVSRRLAALEQRMGERLLLRTTRRQTLTEFGSQLLEHARQIALDLEAVHALREQRQAVPSGALRVSIPADIAHLVLADSLAAFVALHPAISLELDLSPRRVDVLGEGYDLAVRMGALPDDATLVAVRLIDFTHGLYAAPAYLAEHGEPRSPDELSTHTAALLASGRGEAMWWRLSRGTERWEGLPRGRVRANSPEMLIRLAQAGVGITAVPDSFAVPEVRAGRLRRVLPEWCLPSVTAWAVMPGRKLMPAKTRVFLQMLQTTFGRCRGEPGVVPDGVAWPAPGP
jgi:DNA-binding transcriptional LysR family regulator